jgi:hypothetical protein
MEHAKKGRISGIILAMQDVCITTPERAAEQKAARDADKNERAKHLAILGTADTTGENHENRAKC